MKHTHGSEAIAGGRLRGATDTDYFYFFCPQCPNDEILRILDYQFTREEKGNEYNETCKSKAPRSFVIAFDITCERCGLRDCVKVSNLGWQYGEHSKTLRK